jgi:phage-related protein
MVRSPVPGEKRLFWMGDSLAALLLLPEKVKDAIGEALSVAQFGGKHPSAKPWHGEGSGAFEVVESHDGNAYRAVYTVRFAQAAYVLHVFQKKSTRGIKTQTRDVEIVHKRLLTAKQHYEANYGDKS